MTATRELASPRLGLARLASARLVRRYSLLFASERLECSISRSGSDLAVRRPCGSRAAAGRPGWPIRAASEESGAFAYAHSFIRSPTQGNRALDQGKLG